MSAPSLKDLIGKATPSPWKNGNGIEDRHGNKIASVIFCGYEDPAAIANAQLIARCNPATLLAVYEALEASKRRFEMLGHRLGTNIEINGVKVDAAINDIAHALNLLNATES